MSDASRRGWALGLIATAQFMVIMDTSIIGVALPRIQEDLGFTPGNLSWVFNAYVVAFAGLLLLGGRLADLFDALTPATLRDAMLIVVSTRPLNLMEEAERSARLSATSARGPLSRAVLLNAGRDELNGLIRFDDSDGNRPMERGASDSEADRVNARAPEGRRRGLSLDELGADNGEAAIKTASATQSPSRDGPGRRA